MLREQVSLGACLSCYLRVNPTAPPSPVKDPAAISCTSDLGLWCPHSTTREHPKEVLVPTLKLLEARENQVGLAVAVWFFHELYFCGFCLSQICTLVLPVSSPTCPLAS